MGCGWIDQRSNHCRIVARVASLQPCDLKQKLRGEEVCDRMVGKDSLNGNTSLTHVPDPADCATLCGKFQIGIRLYNDTSVSTKFQHYFLLPTLSLQHPSHGGAAGKAQEFKARINDQLFRRPIVAGQDIHCAWRKSGPQNNLSQEQCGQRRLWRWLDEDGIAGGQRWSDLVSDKIQGKVKGGNSQHRPNGNTTNEAEMRVCSRGPVERDYLTGNPLRLFRCNGKCLDGPIYFSFCVGNRFASFSRHQAGKFLTS